MISEPNMKERVSLMPAWGFVPAAHDQALRRLVRATIAQAAYDALKNDYTGSEARAWLMGEDCADWCIMGGVNYGAVIEWVNAGCPDWRKPKNERIQ